jgi:CRP-like cAMP-binding protein
VALVVDRDVGDPVSAALEGRIVKPTGTDVAQSREIAVVLASLLPHAKSESIDWLVAVARICAVHRHGRLDPDASTPRLTLALAGYVGAWRSDADGRQQMVGLTGPGEFAGLVALSPHAPPLELVGLTDGAAASWSIDSVMNRARADADLAVDLLEQTFHSSARLLTRLEHLTFDSVARRLARILWQRRELLFDLRRPLLSRPELADLAGATREMTNRVIRDLEREGIVERIGGTGLILLDADALRSRADLDDDDWECS